MRVVFGICLLGCFELIDRSPTYERFRRRLVDTLGRTAPVVRESCLRDRGHGEELVCWAKGERLYDLYRNGRFIPSL